MTAKQAIARQIVRRVTVDVSLEEVELVREQGECLVASHAYPKGTPEWKQPTEWHEGRTLLALAEKLATARRRAR